MNDEKSIQAVTQVGGLVRPEPRQAISIRAALETDLEFIDSLHKMHTHAVGWMPRKQLENYIAKGNVLIAEVPAPGMEEVETRRATESHGGEEEKSKGRKGKEQAASTFASSTQSNLCGSPRPSAFQKPLGYIIARDQYFKRDDVGIIYQVNVLPGSQRGLTGAALVRSVFERAAYGCRLFCCWCAQDLEANHFWESLGFLPLAFRTGSRNKQRIHIFWQRRVREGDLETPYWFPSQTTGGAIREDRLVIPIPPGTHWSDAKPLILPELAEEIGGQKSEVSTGLLTSDLCPLTSEPKPRPRNSQKKKVIAGSGKQMKSITMGGLRFGSRPAQAPEELETKKPRKKARPKPPRKNDPKYVAAVRELRDRYLEQVNGGELALPETRSKYDIGAEKNGVWEAGSVWNGGGCRLMKDNRPALGCGPAAGERQ